MDKEEKRPELVHSAYIPLERAVKKLWDGKGKVVYRVTTKSGERPEMPEEGYQMVTAEGEEEEEEEEEDEDEGRKKEKKNSVLVTVDLGKGERVAVEDKKYLESFLAPTAMVDGSDEEVQKLAQRVVQKLETYHGPPSPRVLAKGAWAETKRTIKLSNLATGFASASETARTKTGDCSEYAVLLAAILRALGLPSRTCSGLVYLEERDGRANFGWHMWSQVLLPSQEEGVYYWQDLDATLPIPFRCV